MTNLKIAINGQYINNKGEVVTITGCVMDDKNGGLLYTCDSGILYALNGRALPPATFGDSLISLRFPKKKRPPRN